MEKYNRLEIAAGAGLVGMLINIVFNQYEPLWMYGAMFFGFFCVALVYMMGSDRPVI